MAPAVIEVQSAKASQIGRRSLVRKEAIGLTYQSDPSKERMAILTYLSGRRPDIKKIWESRFPSYSEPDRE